MISFRLSLLFKKEPVTTPLSPQDPGVSVRGRLSVGCPFVGTVAEENFGNASLGPNSRKNKTFWSELRLSEALSKPLSLSLYPKQDSVQLRTSALYDFVSNLNTVALFSDYYVFNVYIPSFFLISSNYWLFYDRVWFIYCYVC